ncbi:MAG: zinc-binding dehydrogenase [SAR202 cluster bacterium]|jgi:L-iditol 2-dehydrogenase|nr:zinc-binding dehydrogenase [SAR202 cluster bacterium]MDP6300105.1 zinc-binding dehydrogenase [SAR202 cluster bacterium]MDP7103488.1 zinc-binding dehydrogenase [SAR202 cluster bacterium]MDP7225746.1 zinc-binding dehydrogenase [SAR202 cluster bacterium]MDP7412267.1 zinc-binding dehydrogenase [SAR202 cluster bacterium]|tara:strand:+ start:2504 stop:3481 length:978 start_codon:yes stop_codon:yes gene_type:complete
MTTMPAVLATALKQIRCEEIPVPDPEPGKVLVKTTLASICGSDLHIVYMGWNVHEFPLPHGYPGHEGVGEVVDGGGTGFEPGELVLTAPNIWGSRCFAGYQLIDPQFLLRLPTDTPQTHLLMAQQLGTVVFGCRRLPSLVGKTVVVVGQGSVGLFHDFMLRRIGAHRIIAIEPVAERLAQGRRMGVDEAVDVTGQRATDAVMDLTNGEGADLVIEGVGSVETFNQTLQLVKPLGQIAVFGLPPTMDRVPFDWDTFFRKRLDLHTVFGAQDEPGLPAFQLAVDFIKSGEIDMEPFVTHRYDINKVQDAFELATSKEDGALKVSLTF